MERHARLRAAEDQKRGDSEVPRRDDRAGPGNVRGAGRFARGRRKRHRRSDCCGRYSTDSGVAFSLVRRRGLRTDSLGYRTGDRRRASGVAALRPGSAPRSSSRQALVAPARRRSCWAAEHSPLGARTPRLSTIGRLAAGYRRGRCYGRARRRCVLAGGLAPRRGDRFGRLCRGDSRALRRGVATRPGGAAARQREVVSLAARRPRPGTPRQPDARHSAVRWPRLLLRTRRARAAAEPHRRVGDRRAPGIR